MTTGKASTPAGDWDAQEALDKAALLDRLEPERMTAGEWSAIQAQDVAAMAELRAPARLQTGKKFQPTDLGNAERLVEGHGADLRYCAQTRSWLAWDGKRWAPDATEEVMRRAKQTVREIAYRGLGMLHAAEESANPTEQVELRNEGNQLIRYSLACQGRGKLESMIRLAESEIPIPVTIDQLDAHPWLLNVQNGTLNLRTGEITEHFRDDLITRVCPVEYDRNGQDDDWDHFRHQTMPDTDVERYVQRALGYSMTGTATQGTAFLPYGPTHTGKTTLLEAVKAALGDYAVAVDIATLTGRPKEGGTPRSDIVRLFGSRVAISTEVPSGVKLDEALLKKLTGGDTLVARALYKAEQEASATFVIWIGSNYRPAVRDDDDAVWERVKQIPFTIQHTGVARDDKLKPYLCENTQAQRAVLRWLVDGARAYATEGMLLAPAAVNTLTEDYRREMNPLSTWAEECCVLDPEASSTSPLLRSSYEDFTRRGDRPVGNRRFLNSLAQLPGVTLDDADHDHRMWRGIRVAGGEDVETRSAFQALITREFDE